MMTKKELLKALGNGAKLKPVGFGFQRSKYIYLSEGGLICYDDGAQMSYDAFFAADWEIYDPKPVDHDVNYNLFFGDNQLTCVFKFDSIEDRVNFFAELHSFLVKYGKKGVYQCRD